MKWFQHQSDSYTNIKMQELMEEFGMDGYGIFWICCEIVAQQGEGYCIDNNKNWVKALCRISGFNEEKIKNILQKMSELDMIDEKELKKNRLCIPKMSDYSDDYTRRNRRVSEQGTDSVRTVYGKSRVDKIRLDKSKESTVSASAETTPSPQEITQQFFERIETHLQGSPVRELDDFIDQLYKNSGESVESLWREIQKFHAYWTELNHTGKKQRWQMQKTFEVNRRLATWFGRVGFAGAFTSKKGKGVRL